MDAIEATQLFWNDKIPKGVSEGVESFQKIIEGWAEKLTEAGSDDFWEALKERLETFDEDSLQLAKDQLSTMIDSSDVSQDAKNLIEKFFNDNTQGAFFLGIIAQIVIGLGISHIIKPLFSGMGEKVQHKINSAMVNTLPDLGSLIRYDWRGGKQDWLQEYYGKLGIGDTTRIITSQSARPILTLAEIQRLSQTQNWNTDKVKDWLGKIGYVRKSDDDQITATQETAEILLRPILPISDILELERRGGFDKDDYEKQLANNGLDSEQRRQYKLLKERLLDSSALSEAYRRDLIDETEFIDGLVKQGFSNDDKFIMRDLSDALPDYYLARTLYWRGEITKDQFKDAIMKNGYTETVAKQMIVVSDLLPTQQDLVRMGVREIFTPVIRTKYGMDNDFPKTIVPWGKKIGLSEEVLKMYWAAHWDLPSPGQGYELLHRGEINEEDLKLLLRALDIMPGWINHMIALSYRLIPRRSIPKLVKQGIMKVKDVKEAYKKLGYNDKDAEMFAKSAILDAAEDRRELTKAEIIDDYVYEGSGLDLLETRLENLSYTANVKDVIVAKAKRKRRLYLDSLEDQDAIDEQPNAKELTKNEILRMYKERVIGSERAAGLLQNINFSAITINYLLGFADLQQARDTREAHAKQYRRLFDNRVLPDLLIKTKIISLGYSDSGASELLSLWILERSTDESIEASKTKTPTKADLNDWLKKGVITSDDWIDGMTSLNYSRDDIANYLTELAIDLQG